MAGKHDRSKPHRHELPQHPSAEFEFFSPNLFVSSKTAAAIPIRHPALQDALIQLSLDPTVRSLSYLATSVVASEEIDLGAVVVQRDDGRFLLDVVPARRVRDVDDEGLSLIALGQLGLESWIISSRELLREPRCSNARYVWLYNRHRVSLAMRRRILRALLDKEMPLGELERVVKSDRDPSADVMALVCAGELELDLTTQPIQLTSTVKSRMKETDPPLQGVSPGSRERRFRVSRRPESNPLNGKS
jgi:hypothetical protein